MSFEPVVRAMMNSRNNVDVSSTENTLTAKNPDTNEVVRATVNSYGKMTVRTMIKEIIPHVKNIGVKHIIIVCEDVRVPLRKAVEESGVKVEMFSSMDLIFDITKHVLQPKFEKLYDVNKSEFENYGSMLTTDPIVRWHDWTVGDVIKITRKNGGTYYKVVRKHT